MQWAALFNGEIVGEIIFTKPTVNFIVSGDTTDQQTGTETDWTEPVKNLMPLQINRMAIVDGKLAYRDNESDPKINLTLDSLQTTATNLNNATYNNGRLPSAITAKAITIGGGKLSLNCNANALKKIPDFDLNGKLEGVSLPALNDFAKAYAKLDFEDGTFNLYTEIAVSDGKFEGYIKPIMQNIKIVDFSEDKKKPLKLIWESIAGFVTKIFQNQKKNQFATKVPMSGDLNNPNTKIWPTIGNIFKNAFIKAFSQNTDNDVSFKDVKRNK